MKTIIKHKNKIIVITIILIIIAIPIGLLFYIRPIQYKGSFMMYVETGEEALVEFDVYKHRRIGIGKQYIVKGSIFVNGKEYKDFPNMKYPNDPQPFTFCNYKYDGFTLRMKSEIRFCTDLEKGETFELILADYDAGTTVLYMSDIKSFGKFKQ